MIKPIILDPMKKVMLASILFLMASAVFSQKAIIKKEKGVFVQTETTSKTKFQLSATDEEMTKIKEECNNFADRMNFKAKPAGKNLYDCELEVTNVNFPEYVQKMFMSIGISSLVFDGKNRDVSDLSSILNSLK